MSNEVEYIFTLKEDEEYFRSSIGEVLASLCCDTTHFNELVSHYNKNECFDFDEMSPNAEECYDNIYCEVCERFLKSDYVESYEEGSEEDEECYEIFQDELIKREDIITTNRSSFLIKF